MNAYLFLAGSNTKSFEIQDYFLAGSDSSCHWQIATADPRHAKIEAHNGQYFLKDLRSTAGTFLNEQSVREAPLKEGDWIQILDEELQFSLKPTREKPRFQLQSRNPEWNEKLQRLSSVASTNFPVLLLGPSGCGKEILSQSIHQESRRKEGPFVSVNCSALSENLVESELFGHLKGSFTGALNDRKGAFETARGGTLFLDEVGDLPLSLQAKLLRALENDEIRPVGGDQNIRTDVRVIAATHQNLIEKIQNREFRSDLYYRLNVVTIEAPTLFDRIEDFEDLLYGFAKKMKVRFAHQAVVRLKKHSWPGNIRELRNTVARASALFPRQLIDEEKVELILDRLSVGPQNMPTTVLPHQPLPLLKEMERQMIIRRLSTNYGNQRKTATELGLPKSTLHDRLKAYNIDPRDYEKK
ncbi:MAG: transcriptional regulator [Bdellovibrio sp. CG10_big_fil_rev_8_21_14_0_10_47_8]|nr:MAG: transcriptional regulator [Bdellovibrio sp. CG10_big_fil_rev_8_21_14_0_10_47_8]